MGTQRIDIIINGKNSLSSALKSAAGDVKKLGTDAKTAGTGLTQMGTKGKEASNKLKTGLGSVKSILGELKTGFSSLGGVMSSVLAGFTFAEMVQSAGDVESKWNRIAVSTGKTGAELAGLKSTIRDIANYYGISNGELSATYENAVRFYGASDDTLNKVKGIAATSKLTGKSVEEIYNAFVSGELGRNRQLQKSVLTEEQRNKYLADGKITQDEINQILQENQDTVARNPALINDTNSAYARMENAINKIKNSLGTSLLPVMEKLADIIIWAGDKFSWLDKQTGGWLSTITAVGIALMALGAPLALVWGPVSKILGGFKDIVGKVKDFVLPSTKKVKIDCTKDKDCTVAGSSAAAGGIPWASVLGGAAVVALAQGAAGYGSKWLEDKLGMGTAGKGIAASGAGAGGIFGYQLAGGKVNSLSGAVSMTPVFGQIFGPITRLWENAAQSITSGELSKWFKDKIPKLNWPSVSQIWGGITKWVKDKIPQINWKLPSATDILNWVRGKLNIGGSMNLSSIATQLLNWGLAKLNITGSLNLSRIGRTIQSVASRAASVVRRGPPMGPGDFMSQAAGGFRYEGYGGSRQSISDTIGCMTGNCVDGTLAQMSIASAFGIPSEMIATTWNGGPHVYARIAGRTRDIANHALTGSWSAPPRGPGGAGNMIVIQGDVYGFDDFKRKVEQANNQLVRW